jgi:DNA-binding NarL/FixJ family response regulator
VAVVRVLVVDRNDDLLDGLSAWLRREPNVTIVGSARTGPEAVDLVDRLRPDLLIMDISISGMNGFEATRKIKSVPRAPAVVLMTLHDSEAARAEAWAAGADDLIPTAEVTGRLRKLLEDLAAGRTPWGAEPGRVSRKRGKTRWSTEQGPKKDHFK